MKKGNKNILIYSSAVEALSHLDKVDIHPGSGQRNLDAAYQRLEDIKTISQMLLDQSIDEQMEEQRKSSKIKMLEKITDPTNNQGKRKAQIEASEKAAIISVISCILIIVVLALLK